MRYSLLIICSVLLGLEAAIRDIPNPADNLFHELVAARKLNIPAVKQDEPVIVFFGIGLIQIQNLDEKNEVFTISAIISLMWENPFLTWDPNDYNGQKDVSLTPEHFWHPKVMVINSMNKISNPDWSTDSPLFVSNDSTTAWTIGGRFDTSCSLEMVNFPFDQQKCTVHLSMSNYLREEVLFVPLNDKVNTNEFYPSGTWDITGTSVEESPVSGISTVITSFHLRRKPLYYITNIIFPCILLSVLSSFVYLIPQDAGERCSYSITVFLSFTVFLLMIAESIPKTSNGVPLIVIFLLSMMVLSGLTLLATIMIMNVKYRKSKVPTWVRNIIIKGLGYCVCKRPKPTKEQTRGVSPTPWDPQANGEIRRPRGLRRVDEQLPSVEVKPHEESSRNEDEWRVVADILDRLCFVLNIILIPVISGITLQPSNI